MLAEGAGESADRSDARTQSLCAPCVEKTARPIRRDVCPEPQEVFFEQVGPHGPEIGAEQLVEMPALSFAEAMLPLEPDPARLRQDGSATAFFEQTNLAPTNLVDSFGEQLRDMIAVEDVNTVG